MVRKLFLFAACFSFGLTMYAQDRYGYAIMRMPEQWRVSGLISASATYAPSIGLTDGVNRFHLHGFAEYHVSKAVSVKSDSYLFLNSTVVEFYDDDMFRSYFGAFYHLNQRSLGNWDVKFGILPGITYLKRTPWLNNEGEDPYTRSLAPSISIVAGFDYYVWKYFHFFSQVSYLHSNMRGFPSGSILMNEIVFSAGLGFQIPTIRQK